MTLLFFSLRISLRINIHRFLEPLFSAFPAKKNLQLLSFLFLFYFVFATETMKVLYDPEFELHARVVNSVSRNHYSRQTNPTPWPALLPSCKLTAIYVYGYIYMSKFSLAYHRQHKLKAYHCDYEQVPNAITTSFLRE